MATSAGNCETILVAEDEPELLDIVTNILEGDGYNVLYGRSGEEGSQLSEQYNGKIDLLLTDIVMPGMSGGELAREILPHHPEMRVLYMSGYTKYTVGAQGVLESANSFIWKPFSPVQLLQKVREVLDSPNEAH
jgi:two-component system cell cycle sensor histidine kinase/response regulator CckA